MNIQKDIYNEWGDLKDKNNKDLTTKELCVKKDFKPQSRAETKDIAQLDYWKQIKN